MLNNHQIIQIVKLTASLLELHDENPEKTKLLQSFAFKLDSLAEELDGLDQTALLKTGISKTMLPLLDEIRETETLNELSDLLSRTPRGVIEMLNIKGIGPKKVRTIWKDLTITSNQELLEACNGNKLSSLKGFGEKTQESIRQYLLFSEKQKDKFLYAEAEEIAENLEKGIQEILPDALVSLSGEIRRKMEIVETIQILIGTDQRFQALSKLEALPDLRKDEKASGMFSWRGTENQHSIKVEIKTYSKQEFSKKLLLHSCAPEHLSSLAKDGIPMAQILKKAEVISEKEFFRETGMQYIEPEMREGRGEIEKALEGNLPVLLENSDLQGILHNHTTYSDGAHTLEQMAEYCKQCGYEYLGISDHSKTAFYAGGLYENKVQQQHQEIEELNKKLAPFRIFKGIESDILNDGSLDYEPEVLASFDFIVSSIHSNLKMTEGKATERLIKAIENPFTTILGHSTGRLLLKREGYPIQHKKVIDACSDNQVIIEINANPRRLDMDWRWILYALEKNVWISINPDAHSMEEYHNMKYGVSVGRKAGLSKAQTFNALPLAEVEKYFKSKKTAAGIKAIS